MTPGNRVRRARKQNGLSLREVEGRTERIGSPVSRNTLSCVERDLPSKLSLNQMQTLCQALSVSADWVLLGEDQPAYAIGRRALELPEKARQLVLDTIDSLRKLLENK